MQKENTVYLNSDRKDCIETTFKEMGIRAEKSIAEHILKENVYGSNLISDISSVDYTRGHLGETHLREIQGFPIFVDDRRDRGRNPKCSCIFCGRIYRSRYATRMERNSWWRKNVYCNNSVRIHAMSSLQHGCVLGCFVVYLAGSKLSFVRICFSYP